MSEKTPQPAPRMTPALTEALKVFENDSRRAPENVEALHKLKREDYKTYIDHLYAMSDEEAAGDIDSGRFYRNRLLLEETKTDVGERLDAGKDRAYLLGMNALELSKIIVAGAADKLDDKILEVRWSRAAKRHEKQARKQATWEAKQSVKAEAKLDRKVARRERAERLGNALSTPYRKLARGALSIYVRGLEVTDPARAAARREQLVAQEAEQRADAVGVFMDSLDMQSQSPAVQELMANTLTAPRFVTALENDEIGVISEVFKQEDDPYTQYTMFYGWQSDDAGKVATSERQLTPVLLKKPDGQAWTFADNGHATNYGVDEKALLGTVAHTFEAANQHRALLATSAETVRLKELLQPRRFSRDIESYDKTIETVRKKFKTLSEKAAAETDPLLKKQLERDKNEMAKMIREAIKNHKEAAVNKAA